MDSNKCKKQLNKIEEWSKDGSAKCIQTKGNIENMGVAWRRGYMYPVCQHQDYGQRGPRFLCTCVYHLGALVNQSNTCIIYDHVFFLQS